MALPTSGMIDAVAIHTEVYGSAPSGQVDIVDCYDDSTLTPKTTDISFEDFYGYQSNLIDPSGTLLEMDYPLKAIDSITVDVTPDTMETTTVITTGTFYNITAGATATGDFTLTVRTTSENTSGSPRTGSVTISDDASGADDVVITVRQLAQPD